MSRPRAILFDLGNTLIHFAGTSKVELFKEGASAGHAYLVSRGLRMPPVAAFVRSLLWRGRKAALFNRISRRELRVEQLFSLVVGGLQPKIAPDIWRGYILRMYEPLVQTGKVDPQAKPVLERLRQGGLKVGLVSNTFVPGFAIDAHLARAGLLDAFDGRFYSAAVGLKKPSLTLFRHAARTLGVPARDIWHVGDDLIADVLGARRAGLTAVLRLPPPEPGKPAPLARIPWWWPIKPRHVIRQLDELLDLLELR